MSVMESRSNSLPNPKAKPIASEVPQPPVDFNETFLEPVTDRNVDFSKGKSNVRNHKLGSFILHNLFLIKIFSYTFQRYRLYILFLLFFKLAKRIGAHALRPSNTEMLLTVKSNIINAQVMDIRVPTITDLRVGAITTIMEQHIGTIAQVAVS